MSSLGITSPPFKLCGTGCPDEGYQDIHAQIENFTRGGPAIDASVAQDAGFATVPRGSD
jgi:hypothetical protein